MLKHLIATAMLCAGAADAATYYRDRFIPGGVCMVNFNGNNINASLILEVNVVDRPMYSRDGIFGWKETPYRSLRVTLVNGAWNEVTTGDLKAQETAFLGQIRETCPP